MKFHAVALLLLSASQAAFSYSEHAKAFGVLSPTLRLEEQFSEAALSLSSSLAAPADDRHPFWIFEWDQIHGAQVLECAVVLFLAGLLCSAGGIGGGGIYVSVLMVAGRLSPRDAVPLSKAIVFSGSVSSLALNVGRTLVGASGSSKTIIDYSICRLVVPASLIGTLFGVVINRNAADSAIIILLSGLLLCMTCMVVWTTYTQYVQEEAEMLRKVSGSCAGGPSDVERAAVDVQLSAPTRQDATTGGTEHPFEGRQPGQPSALPPSNKGFPGQSDKYLGLGMLAIVVASGVVRHHASACLWELQQGGDSSSREAACHHPTLTFLVGNRMEGWMGDPTGASWAMILTLAVPISTCLVVMAFSSRACVVDEQWTPLEVAKYELMGVLTGCLAGLVGIGGGLIFSPFFLIMGVEPVIAVATSSTCVIFTSSSTTMQYLFTDRIIVSLTAVYGLVSLVASYGGTAFVHFLQERFATRKSYITAIVAAGVFVSAILSLTKLANSEAQFVHF